MHSQNYVPAPIDTSTVKLTPDLEALTDKLSENAHELWAKERRAQGWTYGEKRDDDSKHHPGLIPYADLTKEEQKLDHEASMGTLRAILALGAVIEAPPVELTQEASVAVSNWEQELKQTNTAIHADPKHKRSETFDMNDEVELSSANVAKFPTLARALGAFQKDLYPKWKELDDKAKKIQRQHRTVARWAIIPATVAILLAIVQLALPHSFHDLTEKLSWVECAVVVLAAFAVGYGYWAETRNRWITARQAAERLRILKFRALADPLLWCDFNEWKARWTPEVSRMEKLDFHAAEEWVHSGSAEPTIPDVLTCATPAMEIRAIADYYREKRLQFQKYYFENKASQHKRDIWLLRLRLPVLLFFLSVVMVMAHVGVEIWGNHGTGHNENESLIRTLLVLAASLPVIGFGLRAWFSAFELPRRAQLFTGKAIQLKTALDRVEKDRLHPRKTLTHLELGEHFFENEHREWCRLILEAEWFM